MKDLITTILLSLSKKKHPSALQNSHALAIPDKYFVFTAWGECDSYLYIGTNLGIFRKSKLNGDLEFLTIKNSPLPGNHITSIVCTSEGYTFLGTPNGIVKCNNKPGFLITPLSLNLPDHYIKALAVDSNDDVWIGTATGGLMKSTGEKKKSLNIHPVETRNKNIFFIAVDHQGSVWVVFQNGVIEYFCMGSSRSNLSVSSIEDVEFAAEKSFLLQTSCQGTFLTDGNSFTPIFTGPPGQNWTCAYYNPKYSRMILGHKEGVYVYNHREPFSGCRKWSYSDFIESISIQCTDASIINMITELKEFEQTHTNQFTDYRKDQPNFISN